MGFSEIIGERRSFHGNQQVLNIYKHILDITLDKDIINMQKKLTQQGQASTFSKTRHFNHLLQLDEYSS